MLVMGPSHQMAPAEYRAAGGCGSGCHTEEEESQDFPCADATEAPHSVHLRQSHSCLTLGGASSAPWPRLLVGISDPFVAVRKAFEGRGGLVQERDSGPGWCAVCSLMRAVCCA